jgi:hypothetical protein
MTSTQPVLESGRSRESPAWPFRWLFSKQWWRDRVAELKYGFEEHGWTGKLFLIECGLSLAATSLTIGMQMIRAMVVWSPEFSVVAVSFGLGFLIPLMLVQGRYILGIARFERWAGLLAPALSVAGAVGSIAALMMSARIGGMRAAILGGAQLALCVQYFVYFVRNRDRYVPLKRAAKVSEVVE